MLYVLCTDPKNHVYIVSGRDREFLDTFFGALNVGMSCEHGLFFRPYGVDKEWETMGTDIREPWKDVVLPILQEFASRTPGSMIEVKEINLSWHYRNADEDFGSWQAKELAVHLQDLAQKLPIEVIHGKKVIEVRPSNVNKGETVRKALTMHPGCNFILCLGDDRTDEDMFEALDSWCKEDEDLVLFTCTVGRNTTSQARYYLRNQIDVMRLIGTISEASEKDHPQGLSTRPATPAVLQT